MDNPSPFVRRLARQLLVAEKSSLREEKAHTTHPAVRVCEKLRISLTRFAGADGFASLLRRSLALARVENPELSSITLKPDSSLQGFEKLSSGDARGGEDAAISLIAHLLGLLVTFIGEPLMLRLVQGAWPQISLAD